MSPTSAFTGGAPCAPYGATPCWAVHLVFGCSALAHCFQCDSVVAFLCIVDVEGPLHARQPVILMPNVTVQGTRHLVEGTLEPLVRRLFHGFNLIEFIDRLAPC